MTIDPSRFCLHLDCRLTRLGIRRHEGHKTFVMRCRGCGCTISTRSLRILKREVEHLLRLGAPLPI